MTNFSGCICKRKKNRNLTGENSDITQGLQSHDNLFRVHLLIKKSNLTGKYSYNIQIYKAITTFSGCIYWKRKLTGKNDYLIFFIDS